MNDITWESAPSTLVHEEFDSKGLIDTPSEKESVQFEANEHGERDDDDTSVPDRIEKSTLLTGNSPNTEFIDGNKSDLGHTRDSLDDLISYQKKFDSTSNAFLEHLRGVAENRKREVTRCRYSLERKEQIMLEEKEEREIGTTTSTISEVKKTYPRVSLGSSRRGKKIEGVDPYKPFKARPLPVTTVVSGSKSQDGVLSVAKYPPTTPCEPRLGKHRRESSAAQSIVRMKGSKPCASVVHVSKKVEPVVQRKSLTPGGDPYVPFKARPMPAISLSKASTRPSTGPTLSLGTKRKSLENADSVRKYINALRPYTTEKPSPKPIKLSQSKLSVNNSALHAKPFKRLLAGKEASLDKEMSQKKRLQEEEKKLRRESTFKALPLPATTLEQRKDPSISFDLVGEKLISDESVSALRSGKENFCNGPVSPERGLTHQKKRPSMCEPFVPRSSIRAEERAAFDAERAVRERRSHEDQIKRRKEIINRTTSEIEDLKKYIR